MYIYLTFCHDFYLTVFADFYEVYIIFSSIMHWLISTMWSAKRGLLRGHPSILMPFLYKFRLNISCNSKVNIFGEMVSPFLTRLLKAILFALVSTAMLTVITSLSYRFLRSLLHFNSILVIRNILFPESCLL